MAPPAPTGGALLSPSGLAMVPFHERRIGVDILLEHGFQRGLGQFALVVEGVADSVQINLWLAQDRAGDARQDILQRPGGADATQRSRRIADDAGRLAQERAL